MFDMSWGEVLVIGAVALVVIGPKDLPKALRTLGNMTSARAQDGVRVPAQFNEAMREAELDDIKKEVSGSERAGERVQPVARHDPLDELKGAIESTAAASRCRRGAGCPGRGAGGVCCRGAARRASRPSTSPCRRRRRRSRGRCRSPLTRPRRQSLSRPRAPRHDDAGGGRSRGLPRAADRPPDRAAHAADPRADRLHGDVRRAASAGAKYIYNILVQPYVWAVGDPTKAHMVYTACAGVLLHAAPGRDVRRRLPRLPGDREPDLQVRRARPLQERAPGVPALPRRDAAAVPARRAASSTSSPCRS